MKIEEVEGIGPVYGEKLALAGIATTDDLLTTGAKRSGRAALEKATGLTGAQILKWVNKVDLMRVPGVGPEYSDLLEAASVDSVAELAQRNPAHLAQVFQDVAAARPHWVRRIPSEETVAGWVEAAKGLPRVVEY
jgi:predicted flap endonuclease-1-like 5' DNA nuclease